MCYLISICFILYLLFSFTVAVDNTQMRGLEDNLTNPSNYVRNNVVGKGDASIEITKYSPYFDNDEFTKLCADKKTILLYSVWIFSLLMLSDHMEYVNTKSCTYRTKNTEWLI